MEATDSVDIGVDLCEGEELGAGQRDETTKNHPTKQQKSKKKVQKYKLQREQLLRTAQSQKEKSEALCRFWSAETFRLSDVPIYLRNGDLYKSFSSTDDSDDADAVENDIPGVPMECRKTDPSVKSLEDLEKLLRTLRYWLVADLPEELAVYCLSSNNNQILPILATFATDYPAVAQLRCICMGDLHPPPDGNQLALSDCTRWATAAALGNLTAMKLLKRCRDPLPKRYLGDVIPKAAAEHGQLSCLKFAHENGCHLSEALYVSAAKGGSLECLKYCRDQSDTTVRQELLVNVAASRGHLHILEFLHNDRVRLTTNAAVEAAACGQLDCLRFLIEHGVGWHQQILLAACRIPWVNRTMFPRTMTTPPYSGQQWPCVRYAIESGCPVHPACISLFAATGQIEMLELLSQRGIDLRDDENEAFPARHAADWDQLECLQYLVSKGCHLGKQEFKAAIRGAHFGNGWRCLDYMIEKKVPWSDIEEFEDTYEYLRSKRGLATMEGRL
jgi:hypothetical protein